MKYPVTLNQELTLIHQEYRWNLGLQPNANLIPSAFLLEGTLNIAALEKALNCVIDRHVSLRLAFKKNDRRTPPEREILICNLIADYSCATGLYAQHCVNTAKLEIQVHFIESLEPEEQEIEIENILRVSYKNPFNFSNPPFVRAHLFQLSHNRYFFVILVHHLVCDIYSSMILGRDWIIFYNSIVSNATPGLPRITRHFGDFALDQYENATNGSYDSMLQHWKNHIDQYSMAELNWEDLPPSFRGNIDPASLGYESIALDGDLIQSWEIFAKSKKMTLFMLYMAACLIFFRKISKQSAVVIQSNLANKTNLDYLNSIGWFSNNWRIAADISDHCTVQDILSKSRAGVLEAIVNQSVPAQLLAKHSDELPKQKGNMLIACDLIQLYKINNSQQKSANLIIEHAPLPDFISSHMGDQLILRLSNYKTGGFFFAIYPKHRLGSGGISRILKEIVNIMTWCVNNEKENIHNYKWLDS